MITKHKVNIGNSQNLKEIDIDKIYDDNGVIVANYNNISKNDVGFAVNSITNNDSQHKNKK